MISSTVVDFAIFIKLFHLSAAILAEIGKIVKKMAELQNPHPQFKSGCHLQNESEAKVQKVVPLSRIRI